MSTPHSNFIEIIEEGESFPWQYTDTNGRKYDSKFVLRLIPDDEMTRMRKKCTGKQRWRRGQPQTEINWAKFSAMQVDYAIVSWEGIRAKGATADLPCEAKYKNLLPERIKAEIIRLCAGKEAGLEEDDEDDAAEEAEEGTGGQDEAGDGEGAQGGDDGDGEGDEDPNR